MFLCLLASLSSSIKMIFGVHQGSTLKILLFSLNMLSWGISSVNIALIFPLMHLHIYLFPSKLNFTYKLQDIKCWMGLNLPIAPIDLTHLTFLAVKLDLSF